MRVAHADPWDDAACARFEARARHLMRLGYGAQDAEDLAERLHLLDVQAEGRALCLGCRHLTGSTATGWRCRNHRSAGMAREVAGDLVALPQRCSGYSEVLT
ncbi:MAG: hypothetical protein ACLGIT_15230 [Gammaproteobacteria bacterium]